MCWIGSERGTEGGQMTQTRLGSFTEAWTNIGVGFSINYLINLFVVPWMFDIVMTPTKALGIGALFTVVALGRGYFLRRWFNHIRFGNK